MHTSEPLSYEQGRDLYWKLCDDEWQPIEKIAVVDQFYRELTRLYPEIDETSESEIGTCPWTCGLHKSGMHVTVTMRRDLADKVAPVVKKLAKKYGLACLDPQNGVILLPNFPSLS